MIWGINGPLNMVIVSIMADTSVLKILSIDRRTVRQAAAGPADPLHFERLISSACSRPASSFRTRELAQSSA